MLVNSKKIVCFGEILWDIFPNAKKLGGAPYNVANSLKELGLDVSFISKIGKDELGKQLLIELKKQKFPLKYLQIDSIHKTGKVIVKLDKNGSAKYEIIENVAWDFIQSYPEVLEMVSKADAFIFGSLIARGSSLNSLYDFLNNSKFRIFDLNLRSPFYN